MRYLLIKHTPEATYEKIAGIFNPMTETADLPREVYTI